jgi:hypothetical protein
MAEQIREPLFRRCDCKDEVLIWEALRPEGLPAYGIKHTCPECGKVHMRIDPKATKTAGAASNTATISNKQP